MDVRRTRPSAIISIVLIWAAAALCLNVHLKEETIYGISGRSIYLEATYRVEPSNKLHSITWKVEKERPTRILQYIVSKNKTLPSTPYRHRIGFDSETGSLVLSRFAESDQGIYQITVTADDGAEDKASTEVTVYEPIAGVSVTMTANETGSGSNATLSCSVQSGTKPEFSWTKDGENITATGGLALWNTRQRLLLHMLSLDDCGTYTCSVTNLLNKQTHSLNLSASSGFPQCELRLSIKKRHYYLLLVSLVILATLLMGLAIYSTKVSKIALQCARSK
ncbi:hepatic and glial cell adhesion molecule-like [Heterodontus francisci]|uniref:hepatic and glial cell adhesion molecule-like n=1 Tax=Heterodontus francisci TaxID=7792 RepID=UPI00355BE862